MTSEYLLPLKSTTSPWRERGSSVQKVSSSVHCRPSARFSTTFVTYNEANFAKKDAAFARVEDAMLCAEVKRDEKAVVSAFPKSFMHSRMHSLVFIVHKTYDEKDKHNDNEKHKKNERLPPKR